MERLTVRCENGRAFCAVNCIGCSSVECDYIYKIIDKAGDYEDTGYTPEQVVEMAKELKRWHTDKVNENIKNVFANRSTLICHNCDHKDKYIEELEQELAELKKQLPPCNIGDTIYVVPSKVNYELNKLHKYYDNNRVYEQEVSEIRLYSNGYLIVTCDGMCDVPDIFYQETWFFTKEEAEAKLKEMEGK